MPALSDSDRVLCAREWIERIFVRAGVTANLTSAQIKSAVDAADDWADANAASFNSALPTAFRNNATTEQKTLLLSYVILKRAGII